MQDIIIAIDIGTTNVKCVAADRSLRILGESQSEYETHCVGIARFEQDSEDWWLHSKLALAGALKQAGASPSSVVAIAVSSQAPTMLPVDADDKPLRPTLIWMDRRSERQCRDMNAQLGEDRVFGITGSAADPYYTFGELLWYRENEPEKYERTHCILQCNGYVNFKFCGEMTIDRAHASLTQCYDVNRGDWSREIMDHYGVPVSLMPRVVECTEVIGGVTAQVSAETGIPEGTPVLGGYVDANGAGLEGGVFEDGSVVEMSGTSSVVIVGTTQKYISKKLTYMYGSYPGQHYLVCSMSTTGASLKWYRNNLYKGGPGNAYDNLNRMIETQCPEPTSLIYLPYLAGERAPIWDSHAKGAFLGITLNTCEAELVRAIQEGAAFALMDNLSEVYKTGAKVHKMRAVGGSTHSDIWMKIKASVIDMPIEIPRHNMGAPGGVLAMIAAALGDYASIQEAAKAKFEVVRVIEPERRWVERYKEQFGLFKRYYEGCRETFRLVDEMRARQYSAHIDRKG